MGDIADWSKETALEDNEEDYYIGCDFGKGFNSFTSRIKYANPDLDVESDLTDEESFLGFNDSGEQIVTQKNTFKTKKLWWFIKCLLGFGSIYDGSICWFSKTYYDVHDYHYNKGGDNTPTHFYSYKCSYCNKEFII